MHPMHRLSWLVLLFASSCRGAGDHDTEPMTSGSSTGAMTTVASSTSPSSTAGSTTALADGPDVTTSADSTGVVFLLGPDGGGVAFECDLFAQDCPPGQKCAPWIEDGTFWDGTKCVPVVDDPAGPGEPCHAEGSLGSGSDDCDAESMCLFVDARTLEGICAPFCVGRESAAQCEDPDRFCRLQEDATLVVCLLRCDPVEPDCATGWACRPLMDGWTCTPGASDAPGVYGDPCRDFDGCGPGLACVSSIRVPPGLACEGLDGCCTELCEVSDPAGDQQCTGAAAGAQCLPYYHANVAPAGYESLGVCTLPS